MIFELAFRLLKIRSYPATRNIRAKLIPSFIIPLLMLVSSPTISQELSQKLVDELEKLSSLFERGLLTDTEFSEAKARILSPEPPENRGTSGSAVTVEAGLSGSAGFTASPLGYKSEAEDTELPAPTAANFSVGRNPQAVNDSGSVNPVNGVSSEVLINTESDSETETPTLGLETITSGSRLQIYNSSVDEEHLNVQIILQGNILTQDSLSSGERATTGLVSLASGLLVNNVGGGLGASVAMEVAEATASDLLLEDYERSLPMIPSVSEEITRAATCFNVEAGRNVTSIHTSPSGPDFFSNSEWKDVYTHDGVLAYLERYTGLNDSWSIDDDTDEVLFVFYSLFIAEETRRKPLSDWRLLEASGQIARISVDSEEVQFSTTSRGKLHSTFSEFWRSVMPAYEPRFPNPGCGTRSTVLAKVKDELHESSELSDMEAFMDGLGIRSERNRVTRSISGEMELTEQGSDRIDFPVEVELHYGGRPRTFSHAVVNNKYR